MLLCEVLGKVRNLEVGTFMFLTVVYLIRLSKLQVFRNSVFRGVNDSENKMALWSVFVLYGVAVEAYNAERQFLKLPKSHYDF